MQPLWYDRLLNLLVWQTNKHFLIYWQIISVNGLYIYIGIIICGQR